MEPTASLVSLLSDLSSVFSSIFGYFGDILGKFTSEPVLILLLGMMFTGGIIGLAMRVLHRR